MKWVKHAPTRSGWYWAKSTLFKTPEVVHVDFRGDEVDVKCSGDEVAYSISDFTAWSDVPVTMPGVKDGMKLWPFRKEVKRG